MEVLDFLQTFGQWVRYQTDIEAVALVGSHARGAATESSDVDLVILTSSLDKYLHDKSWISLFGEAAESRIEPYGRVTSVRVFYENGPEVEYGFATPDWADTPVDKGTLSVLEAGMEILYDPLGKVARIQREISSNEL